MPKPWLNGVLGERVLRTPNQPRHKEALENSKRANRQLATMRQMATKRVSVHILGEIMPFREKSLTLGMNGHFLLLDHDFLRVFVQELLQLAYTLVGMALVGRGRMKGEVKEKELWGEVLRALRS